MTPFSKERRHRRFPVDIMQISGTAVFGCEIVIQDISISGISLLIDRPLEPGTDYTLRIMNQTREIALRGRVIWCREHDHCSRQEDAHLKYAAGLRFEDLGQDVMRDLTEFIERHLIEPHTQVKVHSMSGCRCNIRFPVDRGESAVLNIAETYRVRKLSLGGMLIASVHPFEIDTRMAMAVTIPGNITLDFIARIASCMPSDPGGSEHAVGVEIVEMSAQDRARLKEFIRRLYLEDAGFAV